MNNGMSHPWLAPPPALIADVVAATARDTVRAMSLIPVRGLGRYAEAWTRLLAALPELLRSDSGAVFDAVTRVDVLSTVQELVDRDVDEPRLERAVLALWMALAGHRGLTAPLALPGPFRRRGAGRRRLAPARFEHRGSGAAHGRSRRLLIARRLAGAHHDRLRRGRPS